jgi:hypothetical protein
MSVKVLELRIWTKAAASQINGLNLLAQNRYGRIHPARTSNDDRDGCADGPKGPLSKRKRRRHSGSQCDVPPERTTGRVVVVVGGRVVVVVVGAKVVGAVAGVELPPAVGPEVGDEVVGVDVSGVEV